MGKHHAPEPVSSPDPVQSANQSRPEPVAIAAAAQAVLAALVTLGWVQLDDATIATVATVIAAVVSIAITIVTRSKVTPVSDPRE